MDNSRLIETEDKQLNGGILTIKKLSTAHLIFFMNVTRNLSKVVSLVPIFEWHRHIISSKNKIDLSDHPFIKYDIFEATIKRSPIVTPIFIINYYYEHHNMTFITQPNKNIPRNGAFFARKITNVRIPSIGRKHPTTVKQVMEDVSSQQLTGRCNKVRVITSCRKKFLENKSPIKYIHIQWYHTHPINKKNWLDSQQIQQHQITLVTL